MRLILLTRVNRIVRYSDTDWRQARHIRKAIVADAEEREFMIAELEDARAVDLELLAMFQAVQKSVAVRGLRQNPGMAVGTESRDQVQVPVVTGQCDEGVKLGAQAVSRRKILRVVSLAHIERSSVHLNTLDRLRNENVGVRVSVSVRIGREVVGSQVASHLNVGRDRFAVISRDSRREILWS